MKSSIQYILSLGMALFFYTSCSQPEDITEESQTVPIRVSVNTDLSVRASNPIGTNTHTVNRILVLPFQKVDQAQPNSNNANFIPVWNFAKQWDVSSFPTNSITVHLVPSFTYKVLVIGYNQSDYDYNNPLSPSNKALLTTQPTPTTLANFQLRVKAANDVPEFFTTFCTASQGGTSIGTVFTPTLGSNISLSGQLNRIISGLAVNITGIPAYVKSMTLSAENMVKAIQLADTAAISVQTAGDGENRVIKTLVPASNQVLFNVYLLPTKTTNPTLLYLDVAYGSTSERYTIKVNNSSVSTGNRIMLFPNDALTITGTYSNINLGFIINRNIDLDDNQWDGITGNDD